MHCASWLRLISFWKPHIRELRVEASIGVDYLQKISNQRTCNTFWLRHSVHRKIACFFNWWRLNLNASVSAAAIKTVTLTCVSEQLWPEHWWLRALSGRLPQQRYLKHFSGTSKHNDVVTILLWIGTTAERGLEQTGRLIWIRFHTLARNDHFFKA